MARLYRARGRAGSYATGATNVPNTDIYDGLRDVHRVRPPRRHAFARSARLACAIAARLRPPYCQRSAPRPLGDQHAVAAGGLCRVERAVGATDQAGFVLRAIPEDESRGDPL